MAPRSVRAYNLFMKRRISSETELSRLAREFSRIFPRYADRATVVGLSGDLGSGKTAFTKALAASLGVVDIVSSPTFVIEKRYRIPDGAWDSLVHIDAYRLEDGGDLERLRWAETIAGRGNLVLLEWPEIVSSAIPPDTPIIGFEFVDEHTRDITTSLALESA